MHSPYPSDLQQYLGKHKSALPSPSLCLSLPVIERNAQSFHEKVKAAGVDFRAHVKSNKVSILLAMEFLHVNRSWVGVDQYNLSNAAWGNKRQGHRIYDERSAWAEGADSRRGG